METNDIPDTEVSDWVPMTNPVHLAVLGKAGEELGELISAKDRCMIQGLDGIDPDSGKMNLDWLTDEVADVEAMLMHIKLRFNLNHYAISERRERKYAYKGKWFDKLQRDLDRNIAALKGGDAHKCLAIQYSDRMLCEPCHLAWDTNDIAPPTCPRTQGAIEYVMPIDYPAETLKLMAKQNPKLYIVPFYRELSSIQTKDWEGGKPNNLFLPYLLDYRHRQSPTKVWQDAARGIVSALFPGRELKHVSMPTVVKKATPVISATPKAREPQVIKYMMTVDTHEDVLVQLVKDYPDTLIFPFYTTSAIMPVQIRTMVLRLMRPRLLPPTITPSLGRDEFLGRLRSAVRHTLTDPPFMIVQPDAQFIEVTPPWDLPSKPAEVPETVEWYVGAYIGFNRMRFQYTNHRGVKSQREVRPIKVWFGSTPYHPINSALLKAYDYDRQGERDFEMGQMREVHYIGASENTGG